MKEGQTQQCPKDKGQNDNDPQNMTYNTKDRVTRTPLKTIGDITLGLSRVLVAQFLVCFLWSILQKIVCVPSLLSISSFP
jgi:hypothetical protein